MDRLNTILEDAEEEFEDCPDSVRRLMALLSATKARHEKYGDVSQRLSEASNALHDLQEMYDKEQQIVALLQEKNKELSRMVKAKEDPGFHTEANHLSKETQVTEDGQPWSSNSSQIREFEHNSIKSTPEERKSKKSEAKIGYIPSNRRKLRTPK